MKQIKPLFIELFLFAAAQIIGIYTAYNLILLKPELIPAEISLFNFIIAFLIATSAILLALKFFKGQIGFKLLFIFLIGIGSKTIFQTFTTEIIAISLAIIIIAMWLLLKYILIHNLVLILAIAGIGATLGLSISLPAVILLLSALSLYDVLAVYKTQHMISMFKNLMSKGVLLSLVAPEKLSGFLQETSSIKLGKGFVLLGTGDVAFPLILAVSALTLGLRSSLFVFAGSLVGVIAVYLLLTYQTQHRALPALPPIAGFSLLGLLLSVLV